MAYCNESTPLESNQLITKAHRPSHVILFSFHTDPHGTTEIDFLLSSTHNEERFFHTDPNQYISNTSHFEGAAISKVLSIPNNTNIHQPTKSHIFLTSPPTKPH